MTEQVDILERFYHHLFFTFTTVLGFKFLRAPRAMILLVGSINRHVAGFFAATVGWILLGTSMGLVAWRVWHMDGSPLLPAGLACVGVWRVCVYRHSGRWDRAPLCYHYRRHDAFLPRELRAAQHLLLAASALGLLGKAACVLALRGAFAGSLRESAARRLFAASGLLHLAASVCAAAAVLWNYVSAMKAQPIAFPPAFQLPDRPDAQEVGNASLLAAAAALLLLLSGFSFLSHRFPLHSQVHPEDPQL